MTAIATGLPSGLETDPLAGTGYRLIRRVGAGAMGQVFEAEHLGLRRSVAVKLLSRAFAGDPAFVDRLRLEAQALARVRHPNVVLVHDHALTPEGVPFLAMELLHGRTLHSLLKERGSLPLVEALTLLDQVFAGLMAIHAAGLTHRDLKPGNIFLCQEHGRTVVKLLDLGLVKVAQQDPVRPLAPLRVPTREGEVLGTPACMAPEQILGNPCDARADVYAAGVLVFLIVAGRGPFHGYRTDLEILTAHITETPPPLSKVASQPVPPAMDAVLARALAKEPAARYASIADFGAALSASLAEPAAWRRDVTEKISASTFRGTAPLNAGMFRAPRTVLPFVPVDDRSARPPPPDAARQRDRPMSSAQRAKDPPSFGLPAAPSPSAPERKDSPALSPALLPPAAPRAPSEPWWTRDPLLYALVALICFLLVLVAWSLV